MVLSKNNRFSIEEAKLYSSHQEKKKGTSMWNAWDLWVYVLHHASNFVMETEDNSIQKQLYDFSII